MYTLSIILAHFSLQLKEKAAHKEAVANIVEKVETVLETDKPDEAALMALPPELPILIDDQAIEDILGVRNHSYRLSFFIHSKDTFCSFMNIIS